MPLEIPEQLNIAEEFITRPAREFGARVAILGEPRPVTYAELGEAVDSVAGALLERGCRRGDRVLVLVPDSVEFLAVFFGAAKLGAIAVPVNPMARAADHNFYARNCAPRFAFVHVKVLTEWRKAECGGLVEHVIAVGDDENERDGQWREFKKRAAGGVEACATLANDPAFILYTSGSGGQPKGVVHRHKNMLATSQSFARGVLGLRADDRLFSVSKLFFAYGLGNGGYFPLSVGASVLLDPERPKPERIAALVRRYRPTVFFSVPTFYGALLRESERGLRVDFSSVRTAVSAGESLPAEVFERFRERFGLEILDGIGSTEMLHMFLSCRPGMARGGSCGVPVPNYEARIVDSARQELAEGEIGSLLVKGPSAFSEYWRIPDLTARTKQEEWVVTGDKFYRDAAGFHHYCGRADDMMKVSGMWVSPGEVENALLSHPGVGEAAVVGIKDAMGLTRTVAVVVASAEGQGSGELATEIQEWVKARLVGYKCPQEVRFVSELPKTTTGKIQRYLLRGE